MENRLIIWKMGQQQHLVERHPVMSQLNDFLIFIFGIFSCRFEWSGSCYTHYFSEIDERNSQIITNYLCYD